MGSPEPSLESKQGGRLCGGGAMARSGEVRRLESSSLGESASVGVGKNSPERGSWPSRRSTASLTNPVLDWYILHMEREI